MILEREQVRGELGNTRYRVRLGPITARVDLETDLQSAGIPGAGIEARMQRGRWPDPFLRLRVASTVARGNAFRATLYLYGGS